MEFGAKCREDHYLFEDGTAMCNHGSYGAVPRKVMEKQQSLQLSMERTPDRWFRETTPRLFQESISALAEFTGAKKENLMFIQNPTTGEYCVYVLYISSTPSRDSQHGRQQNRPLRLLNVNFQSASGKPAEIANMLQSTKPDVVFGSETWLNPCIKTPEFFPDGFNVYRKDRVGKRGGGVLIAVRDHLQCTEVPELDSGGEMLWLKLLTRNQRPLYLCAFYRPDSSDQTALEKLDTALRRAAAMKNAQLIIAGDFNFPSWDWETMTFKPNPAHTTLHRQFVDLLYDTGLDQMVLEPTRGENTLDLVLTNCPSLIPRVEVIPGISDHNIVYFEFKTKPDALQNAKRTIFLYGRANWDSMKEDMIALQQDFRDLKDIPTEKLWQMFKSALKDSMARHIPTKKPRRKESLPWMTPDILRLIRKRNRLYRKMKKSGCQITQKEVKNLNREIRKLMRRSYWRYTESLFSPTSSEEGSRPSQKRFWTYMKHQRSTTTGVPALKSNGKLITDPKQKAELLNKQFYTAFSEGAIYSAAEFRERCSLPDSRDDFPPMEDIKISTFGIEKLLTSLNPTKAAGPDGITPRVLKELAKELAPILTKIFQSSLCAGQVPQDWKEALVTPVFKKGEHYKASNYRPISLTSVPAKVLEHILVSAIMCHLESNNILSTQQHGFRKHRSCETQLLEFTEEVSSAMERGVATDVIIMDFQKAFDRVNHSLLVHKLDHYGIRGRTNRWIANFLSARKQAVVVNGAQSSYVNVRSGVPQGTVLGPCLFITYINDLPQRISSTSRLFADDTAVYRLITCSRDSAKLQEDLNKLEDWEREWDMAFHPDKCHQLPLTRARNPQTANTSYTLHNHTLERVPAAKYLGVTLQTDLSWGKHIDNTSSKANRMLCLLRRNLRVRSRKTKELAYKALVRPILEYASSVWDPHSNQNINKLEKVQRRAARFVLHRYRNTSSVSAMLEQLQWPTLQNRRRNNRLTMLYKITQGLACVSCEALKLLPGNSTRRRRGHSQQYQQLPCRTNYRQYSFLPRTIRDWNSLPEELPPVAPPAVNSVLKSFPFGPGDAVLVTNLTYGAVRFTAETIHTCAPGKALPNVEQPEKGAECVVLEITGPITDADQIIQQYKDALEKHPNIKLAVIDTITSPTAIAIPVAELVSLCHLKGVQVLLDGAHTPGQQVLQLEELGADYFTGTLHKWLFAPRGCAFLWVRSDHHTTVRPVVTSWFYQKDLQHQFHMQGTRDDSAYFCSPEAINFHRQLGGLERIVEYSSQLRKDATKLLLDGWRTETLGIPEAPYMECIKLPLPQTPGAESRYPPTPQGAMSLQYDTFQLYQVQCAVVCMLDALWVRISVFVYSTRDDFLRLRDAVLALMARQDFPDFHGPYWPYLLRQETE
ncbi:hypothetical protein Bbelb_072790 [Branchiostoma belcheri]|nr:hypothetical protein Bbelb_072790 [Branchiostoma belcheri]